MRVLDLQSGLAFNSVLFLLAPAVVLQLAFPPACAGAQPGLVPCTRSCSGSGLVKNVAGNFFQSCQSIQIEMTFSSEREPGLVLSLDARLRY